SARCPASTASSDVAMPGLATCRHTTPVRFRIHSSEVSSTRSSWSFVMMSGGVHDPRPQRTGARIGKLILANLIICDKVTSLKEKNVLAANFGRVVCLNALSLAAAKLNLPKSFGITANVSAKLIRRG
ncbi:MAG TPA: hypothetical protein VIV12_10985, partial [Streptosporangiaceae bacterium]